MLSTEDTTLSKSLAVPSRRRWARRQKPIRRRGNCCSGNVLCEGPGTQEGARLGGGHQGSLAGRDDTWAESYRIHDLKLHSSGQRGLMATPPHFPRGSVSARISPCDCLLSLFLGPTLLERYWVLFIVITSAMTVCLADSEHSVNVHRSNWTSSQLTPDSPSEGLHSHESSWHVGSHSTVLHLLSGFSISLLSLAELLLFVPATTHASDR